MSIGTDFLRNPLTLHGNHKTHQKCPFPRHLLVSIASILAKLHGLDENGQCPVGVQLSHCCLSKRLQSCPCGPNLPLCILDRDLQGPAGGLQDQPIISGRNCIPLVLCKDVEIPVVQSRGLGVELDSTL